MGAVHTGSLKATFHLVIFDAFFWASRGHEEKLKQLSPAWHEATSFIQTPGALSIQFPQKTVRNSSSRGQDYGQKNEWKVPEDWEP